MIPHLVAYMFGWPHAASLREKVGDNFISKLLSGLVSTSPDSIGKFAGIVM